MVKTYSQNLEEGLSVKDRQIGADCCIDALAT